MEIGSNGHCFETKLNLDHRRGYRYLLMSNLFGLFQLQKTPHKVIFYKVVKAGSESALRKTAGSGSANWRTVSGYFR